MGALLWLLQTLHVIVMLPRLTAAERWLLLLLAAKVMMCF
jgi:hypothetical protein